VVEGFPIHQAIGFTTFIKDLFLDKLEKKDLLKCFHFFHKQLRKIYKNIDTKKGKNTKILFLVIVLLDILHHSLRVLSALPNIICNDSKKAIFRILHNILHWISFFSAVIYAFLPSENKTLFELLVQKPFLLAEWFCLNGM
jgi:hypothetical protein